MITMDDSGAAPADGRQSSPAAQRNRGPLLDVLKTHLAPGARVLEIASGSGEHIMHFARELPANDFTPSDMHPGALTSIRAWREALQREAPDARLHPPLALDVGHDPWPLNDRFDVMLCFNMIHIAPWQATLDLFDGAAQHLTPQGWLLLYGPFSRNGVHHAESNAAFHQSLQARDSRWGVRDLEQEVLPAARDAGLALADIIEMPANNLCVRLSRTR
ncbi:class I SAM-dependent methyltransferase [Kushneria sp. AK178]